MVNFKKLIAGFVSASLVVLVLGANPVNAQTTLADAEFDAALSWAYETGLTKYNTTEAFMPYNLTTREQGAKLFAATAATSFCIEADSSADCSFSDVSSTLSDATLVPFVGLACEMGLVKGSNGMFYPMNNMSKAEAITILVRTIRAASDENPLLDETTTPWYSNYFMAAQTAGITNDSIDNLDRPVTRYETVLMLYRAANAVADTIECSEDVSLTDLLADLFGDSETPVVDEEVEEEVETTTTVSEGMVMATLSDETPNGTTVPGLANIEVAAFDFTADGEDVQLETVMLERFGLGSEDVIEEVTLLINGAVVSKSRSFNSDDEASLVLNPEITIKAGETVTVVVLAEIGNSTDHSNEEFSIALTNFETNGDEDTSNLPIRGNEFEVAGTDAAVVTVTEDGNLSDIELGENGAEIASFTIENDSDDMVFITTITLEDEESEMEDNLENFILEFNGNEVAMVASVDDKYITFTLDTPVEIDENEEEDFKVLADVIAGAGEQINLIIDESIYVRGYDERYGFGLAVTADYTPDAISINAGELTLIEIDNDRDELRGDRDDFVIAAFDININAGQDLSLEDIEFLVRTSDTLGTTTTITDLYDHFDEVQLIITTDGTRRTYDLDESDLTAQSFRIGDDDLGVFLSEGSDITISLEVDTVNQFPTNSFGDEFEVVLNINDDVKIIENDDDEEVTDIVPSQIVFDSIEFVDSSVEINAIGLSNVEVVKGAENVDAVKFEIETDDVSAVIVEGFEFTLTRETNAGINFQDYVDAVRVWMLTDSGYELLEAEGGFDIGNDGVVTLDDFDPVTVELDETMEFLFTIDVSDNDQIVGEDISAALTSADIEDDDNVQLCSFDETITCGVMTSNNTGDSTRLIRITGSGTLDVIVDNNDPETNRRRHILAGNGANENPYVASFELIANNESVKIDEFTLNVTDIDAGSRARFLDSIDEVVVHDEDGNVIASERVSTLPLDFNNVGLIVEEGSTNVYVTIVADRIGNNEEGQTMDDVTFSLTVVADEVDGVDSGDEVTVTYEGIAGTRSDESRSFDVVAVHVSSIDINIGSTDNKLVNGEVTLGDITVQADSWNNKAENSGEDLQVTFSGADTRLGFFIESSATVVSVEVQRLDIDGGNDDVCDAVINGDFANYYVVDFSTCDSSAAEIEEGVTAQFRVDAVFSGVVDNASAELELNNLNSGSVKYSSTDGDSTQIIDELRLGVTRISGEQVSADS